MTIKELAHSTQDYLQTTTALPVKRSHVYELLAALFGYKSFAAFSDDALLADAGVGSSSPDITPELIGRAVQLGYPQAHCPALAQALSSFAQARQVSCIHLNDLFAMLSPAEPLEEERDGDWDDDSEADSDGDEWEDDDIDGNRRETSSIADIKEPAATFMTSGLLMDGLEKAAAGNNTNAHFALAAIYRCERLNGYLHVESVKGRVLTKLEQEWADHYVQQKPRFDKYEYHLRQAAVGGVRQAAAEFAQVFYDSDFYALAEHGTGPVNARQMVKVATLLNDVVARRKWLRVAGEEGSFTSIKTLAQDGDLWALRKLAEHGDIDAMRQVADEVKSTDLVEAWMWQHLAMMHGTDLRDSNMRAYHDGGPYAGQQYDGDFGGGLYAVGDSGVELKPLNPEQDSNAQKLAREIFNRIPDDA